MKVTIFSNYKYDEDMLCLFYKHDGGDVSVYATYDSLTEMLEDLSIAVDSILTKLNYHPAYDEVKINITYRK